MFTAIVVAAGQGRRFGGKKQFERLKNKPVLVRSIEKLEKIKPIKEIILVLPRSEIKSGFALIKKHRLKKVKKIVPGGKERSDSVRAGLEAIKEKKDSDLILIHDAVRPLVSEKSIYSLIRAARRWGGAILGIPVKDTLKEVANNFVVHTLHREKIRAIQTPQAFRYDWLEQAYRWAKKYNFRATDDAQLVEKIGKKVRLVEGKETNIKITTPLDLKYAEMILRRTGARRIRF